MEQSDAMLISSLKEYISIPNDINTIKDIRTEHIYYMACAVFETLKIDYTQLKQISKAQRFRSMTKLTQTINHEIDTAFELNDIMNPTLPFLRKLLLAFISKLGAVEGERNKAIINQNSEGNQNRYQKQVLKRWINTQFICPELRINKKIKYQPYMLKMDFKKDLFKRNIISELNGVPGNSNAVVRTTMMKETMERKKRQAEQGFTRKANEENERNVQRIVKNNTEDWQKSEIALKKIKKQLIKKIQQSENEVMQSKDPQSTQMSVFQQQVEKIAEEHKKLKGIDDRKTETETKSTQVLSMEQNMNPLQKIKRQCENTRIQLQRQLQQILYALNETKQSIDQKEILKQKLQDQTVLYEQKAAAERQARAALKSQVQKQKILLDTIEGDTDISKQVQQLEQQIKYLETEAEKQITGLQKQIENTKKQGQQKLQILKDLKIRLNKIETDYTKVCEEIQDKSQIKSKVKITKSGISRLYYSKKISEMEVRWRETQRQSKKIYENVGKLRDDIKRTLSFAEIAQKQIQNCSNTNRLKHEPEHASFKEIFLQCQKTFNQTIKCIEEINETKNQIQEYEMKVHTLAGKDYKQGMKKLQAALEELKREIKQLNNKK